MRIVSSIVSTPSGASCRRSICLMVEFMPGVCQMMVRSKPPPALFDSARVVHSFATSLSMPSMRQRSSWPPAGWRSLMPSLSVGARHRLRHRSCMTVVPALVRRSAFDPSSALTVKSPRLSAQPDVERVATMVEPESAAVARRSARFANSNSAKPS